MLKFKIAQKIKEIRKQKNIPQKELADILGCEQSFISKAETGTTFYNLEHIEKLCAVLNHPVHLLFMDESPPQEELPPDSTISSQANDMVDERRRRERRRYLRRGEDRQLFTYSVINVPRR